MLVAFGVQIVFAWPQQKRVERVLHAADEAARELDVLGHLLERLEREQFSSSRLAALRHDLVSGPVVASSAIHTLHRFVEWRDWQHNLYFLMLSMPFMWGTHIAGAIEAGVGRMPSIRQWVGLSESSKRFRRSRPIGSNPGRPVSEILD